MAKMYDAVALVRLFQAEADANRGTWNALAYFRAQQLLERQPTIEVEPVRHGRWERTDYPEFIMGDFECSVCEHLECDIDTSCLMPGENCLYYCPNCGAKMDGGT